jgi:hypothetical protein
LDSPIALYPAPSGQPHGPGIRFSSPSVFLIRFSTCSSRGPIQLVTHLLGVPVSERNHPAAIARLLLIGKTIPHLKDQMRSGPQFVCTLFHGHVDLLEGLERWT